MLSVPHIINVVHCAYVCEWNDYEKLGMPECNEKAICIAQFSLYIFFKYSNPVQRRAHLEIDDHIIYIYIYIHIHITN